MQNVQVIRDQLQKFADKEKAEFFPKFFQDYPGGYGEGDKFIGVTVPNLRKVAKSFYKLVKLNEVMELLHEPIHEYRLTALFMLVYKYKKAKDEADRKLIVDLYLNNTSHINNWDLVDSSADKILGPYFLNKDKNVLYDFAYSNDLWKQRIAIITTFQFIKNNQYDDTLRIASILLNHKHDLIHKAVGWMLRETGKRDFEVEYNFLKDIYQQMPRTMLRYAIEKFDEDLRQRFLKGLVS